MQFLITGATGDVGSRVVDQLIAQGVQPYVFVRDAGKARSRLGQGVSIREGDLADGESLQRAMDGIDAIFLVTSGPGIPILDRIAADAAKKAGVRRIVKLSSLDVEQRLALGAWHERGESAIRESGVSWTFLRPSGFMTNLLAWAEPIKTEGKVRSSTGNGRRAFIHPDDIAAVSVHVLNSGGFENEVLPLTGPEALSFGDVTARIGGAIGRELKFEAISDDEARRRFKASGASEQEVEAHVELWRAIREGKLGVVTETVEQILGRKPIGIDRWIAENAAAFGAEEHQGHAA